MNYLFEVKALVFSATLPLSGLELHVRLPYPDGRAKRYRIAIAPARVGAADHREIDGHRGAQPSDG